MSWSFLPGLFVGRCFAPSLLHFRLFLALARCSVFLSTTHMLAWLRTLLFACLRKVINIVWTFFIHYFGSTLDSQPTNIIHMSGFQPLVHVMTIMQIVVATIDGNSKCKQYVHTQFKTWVRSILLTRKTSGFSGRCSVNISVDVCPSCCCAT